MQLSPTYTKIQWGIILLVLLIDVIWISVSSFNIYFNVKMTLLAVGPLSIIYMLYLFYKLFRPDPKILKALLSTFFFLSFSAVAFVLSYLTFTTNFPLFDETLAHWDSLFGFNAQDLVLWFQAHQWLNMTLKIIYGSYYPQLSVIVIYFSFFVKTNDIQRYITFFMISALISIFVSIYFPAVATYGWYKYPLEPDQISTINTILELRNHVIDFSQINGIITFPSFHTTIALITIYTFRNYRKIVFIPVLILNILMIFSCLSNGGHYLVDLFAGTAVFLVAAVIEYYIFLAVRKHQLKQESRHEYIQ